MDKKILDEYKVELSKIWKTDQHMIDYCKKLAVKTYIMSNSVSRV